MNKSLKTSIMKQLFFLSVVLLLANACGRDRTDTDPATAPAVRVELRVRPDCTGRCDT